MIGGITLVKTTALLCAGLFCQPALYGVRTPEGMFTIKKVYVRKSRHYALLFARIDGRSYTIHPIWLGNPSQRRQERLASMTARDNVITGGCINVSGQMFDRLWQLPDGTEVAISNGPLRPPTGAANALSAGSGPISPEGASLSDLRLDTQPPAVVK